MDSIDYQLKFFKKMRSFTDGGSDVDIHCPHPCFAVFNADA